MYRPYIFKGPAHLDEATSKLWQQKSLDKARSAAANTTHALEGLLEANLMKDLKSMTWASLVSILHNRTDKCVFH